MIKGRSPRGRIKPDHWALDVVDGLLANVIGVERSTDCGYELLSRREPESERLSEGRVESDCVPSFFLRGRRNDRPAGQIE